MENVLWLKWALLIGIPLLLILLYRAVLRVFFGLVIVPEDKIGLVLARDGNGGPINGLLGLQLLEQLQKKNDDNNDKG